jgi:hypothetical protein
VSIVPLLPSLSTPPPPPPRDLGLQPCRQGHGGDIALTCSHAGRAGDGKGDRSIAGGEEASPEPPPPAGSRSRGRSDELGPTSISCLTPKGMMRLFPSLSELGTSKTLEGGRTHKRPLLAIVSTFQA